MTTHRRSSARYRGSSTTMLPPKDGRDRVQCEIEAQECVGQHGRARVRPHLFVLASHAHPFEACEDNTCVPMILLRGPWLRRIGLRTGTRIRIDASQGRIVITLLSATAPQPESMPVNFRKYQRERPRRSNMQGEHPLPCQGGARLAGGKDESDYGQRNTVGSTPR